MPAHRVPVEHGALSSSHIMIMEFDPTNAEMAKFGDTYADSEFNRAEAERDAEAAAEKAASKGLKRQYLVVRVNAVAAFASYPLPE
ncbi:hypothetical protein BC793_13932 [Actinoplanes xinjiangensis]|uniref:Uncharacterized protein n=2 Tax=Actinoplanes xinjiangensis TaxID=512350 RepID=A0A316EK63_9ACTN|nr:hypothetical protein BC793_13932 [Actinoplanes xinjiangensis]GIF44405.1 hypothetical protein Axi01nite_87160 [Actinoplanes xinjiangensis]